MSEVDGLMCKCSYDTTQEADLAEYLVNSLQAVELSGHPGREIVVNTSLQTVSSTFFSGSESGEYIQTLALLAGIHARV